MEKIRELWQRYREVLSYLIFGVLTTLVNIVGYWLARQLGLITAVANALALTLSILFAYVTNRLWVFESRTHGAEALREFAQFILCRAGTALVDEAIMVAGVEWLGPRLFGGKSSLWELGVKVFASVLVIALNYVFSKLVIFKK